jgi:hypothetical protein
MLVKLTTEQQTIFTRIPDSFLPLPTRTITNQLSGEEDKKENFFQ